MTKFPKQINRPNFSERQAKQRLRKLPATQWFDRFFFLIDLFEVAETRTIFNKKNAANILKAKGNIANGATDQAG